MRWRLLLLAVLAPGCVTRQDYIVADRDLLALRTMPVERAVATAVPAYRAAARDARVFLAGDVLRYASRVAADASPGYSIVHTELPNRAHGVAAALTVLGGGLVATAAVAFLVNNSESPPDTECGSEHLPCSLPGNFIGAILVAAGTGVLIAALAEAVHGSD